MILFCIFFQIFKMENQLPAHVQKEQYKKK